MSVDFGLMQWKLDGPIKLKDICSRDREPVQESQPPSSQVPDPLVLCQDLLSGGEQHQALPL